MRTITVMASTLSLVLGLPPFASFATAAQPAREGSSESTEEHAVKLRIDPRMIAEAAEVWALIAAADNPIWPGWNASDTPILFYLPGEQDVLINHPRPPEGFLPYDGPVRFPRGRIWVRDGGTMIEWDGENTSRPIEGVPTLVVADALSNLRQQMRGLLEDPRPPAEKAKDLGFPQLATDPYDQLGLIVHEAFHVFQEREVPAKGANEMLLSKYPVLSVENNVGFAQEGKALSMALRSQDAAAFRAAVVRWVALRQQRRSRLPSAAIEYENGVEFGEGLAKYTEYRLLEALEGRTPGPEMWWVQGFHGYDDLAARRAELVDRMVQHMRGGVSVNNDPYGTAPLRMRLYYSGMAIAALLDRLSMNWKEKIFQPKGSLTDLVEDAVDAKASERRKALEEVREEGEDEALVVEKTQLAERGRARIDSMLAQIEHGAGTGFVVDYGALETPDVAMSFTPFGITAVDENRVIYGQVPIAVRFADGSQVSQLEPRPLLHDRKQRLIRFRLLREATAQAITRALGSETPTEKELADLKLALPEVEVTAASAVIEWKGRDLWVILKPRRK